MDSGQKPRVAGTSRSKVRGGEGTNCRVRPLHCAPLISGGTSYLGIPFSASSTRMKKVNVQQFGGISKSDVP